LTGEEIAVGESFASPLPWDVERDGPLVAGVVWAAITGICAAGAVGEWLVGLHGAAILCLVIAVGSGWFDFRIWVPRRRSRS
jgi:hypothetical protein